MQAPTNVIIAPPREEHSIATSPQIQTERDTTIVSNTATQDVQSLLPVCPIEITELTMSISNPPSPIPASTGTTLSHSNPPSPIPPFNNTDHHFTVSSNPPSPLSATKHHTSSNPSTPSPSPATLKSIQSARNQKLSSKSDHLQVLSCTLLPRSPLVNHSSLHPTKDSTKLFHTPTASPNSVSRPMPSPRRLRATQSMTELKQSPQPRSTARSQSLVPQQATLLQQTTADKTQQISGQSNSHNAKLLTLTRDVTSPLPQLPQCIDDDHFATTDTLSSLPVTTILKNMAVVNGPTAAANIPQYNSTRRSSSPFPSPDTHIRPQIIRTDSVPGLQYTAIDLGTTIKGTCITLSMELL